MSPHIPQQLIERTAFQMYKKRSKRGIVGTPNTDWEQAQILLGKQPWRIGWWWLKHSLLMKWSIKLISAPLILFFKILLAISFPFRLPIRLWQLTDDKDFWKGLSDKEQRSFNLDVIKVVLSALGLVATVIAGAGLLATYWDNIEDRRITQERLVTERFATAISFLGEENDETVRIGGIYSLERIAKDSPKDHWTIVEVLTSYIRKHSPLLSEEENNNPVSIDVQAALTVLGRRNISDIREPDRIDLNHTNLIGADLTDAYLKEAELWRADLSSAYIVRADLSSAYLNYADLSSAYILQADLTDAYLSSTDLSSADLFQANLSSTDLTDADFTDAYLKETDLTGADLTGAEFTGADLQKTKLSKHLTEEQQQQCEIYDPIIIESN